MHSDFLWRLFLLHNKANNLAFNCYIRQGHVPPILIEYIKATSSLDAFIKYNPDQPRVPAGNPDGG